MPRYSQDGPVEQPDPTQPAQPSAPITKYDFLGYDANGLGVYQGSDGQMYTDGNGPNGFVAYNGPGVKPTTPAVPPPSTPTPTPPTTTSPTPTNTAPGGPAPSFNAPSYTPPPKFSYADFVAPSPEDLNADPTYQYTLKSEQDAIQKSAAARGILNTGQTVNDLLLNAKDIASTGYHDLWSRKANEYSMNRSNAADTYRTNYDSQFVDPYKFSYGAAQDTYNANVHNYDLNKQYGWYGKLFDYQQQSDLFDRKYRLLGI